MDTKNYVPDSDIVGKGSLPNNEIKNVAPRSIIHLVFNVTMDYTFIQYFVIAFQLTVLISECRYHFTKDKYF